MAESRLQTAAPAKPPARPGTSVGRSLPLAGLFAWLAPGLGHFYLGYRKRAVILFVTTSVTFWTGVAVGGVKSTVHPTNNGAWFAAQLCMGTQTLAAWAAGSQVQRLHPDDLRYTAFWPSDNVAVVYSGIAGLLNLLVMIDALARADAAAAVQEIRSPVGRGAP